MITLCRTTGMAGVIASSVLVGACAVTIKPIAAPVTALAWDVGPASYDEVVTTATSLAPDYSYQILEASDERILVSGAKLYGAELDDHCIYPIVNLRTGGRLHTFGTWQLELYRSQRLFEVGRVDGNVLIEIARTNSGTRVRSNCRAFTQLGTQPAESIGTYEKELVDAIRDRLPAPSASTPTSAPKQLSEGEAIEPSSTPVERPSGPCDLDVELRKLDRLRVDGLLTDEEFAELKEKLLARCG